MDDLISENVLKFDNNGISGGRKSVFDKLNQEKDDSKIEFLK